MQTTVEEDDGVIRRGDEKCVGEIAGE